MHLTNVGMVITLIILVVCPIVKSRPEPSENLETFVSIFNGFYTNKAQVKFDSQDLKRNDKHDMITTVWKPGYSDLFPNKWVIYLEQFVNGLINRMQLLVLSEDNFGIITAHPYNVVHPSDYIANQNEYADLSNLTLESKTPNPFCKIMFDRLEKYVYVGTYPDCNSGQYWLNPRYAFTITCNTFSVIVCSQATKEAFGKLPYIHYRKRYYSLSGENTTNVIEDCTRNEQF